MSKADEVESSIEDEKDSDIDESREEHKSEEEESSKDSEKESEKAKEGFVKDDETVEGRKFNQALRKAREAEFEAREAKKRLEELEQSEGKKKPVKKEDEDEDENFFDADEDDEEEGKPKKKDLEALVDERVKPLQERLNQREEEDRKKERSAFFKRYPEYLADKKKFTALLDEMDRSLNPNSPDSHYKQLVKAHRILTGDEEPQEDPAIEKKKREMASESASKDDGSQKPADRQTVDDERSKRLLKTLPKEFQASKKSK